MKINTKIRINITDTKNIIKNIVLLIPFFELQSFDMLVDRGVWSGFFGTLLNIYSVLRIIITIFLFLDIFRKNESKISYVVVCTILFILLENIVSFVNGSIYLNYLVGSFTFIGFSLMCAYMIKKSEYQFIIACKYLFGTLSILGAIQIIIMPYGFFNATSKAFAIYFLGSKNTSFFYFIIYLFFAFYYDIKRYYKISFKHILIQFLFIIATIYADSINSLLMLFIILIFSIIFNYGKIMYKFISPKIIIFLIITFAIIILSPTIRKSLEYILNLFGRDTSFTGRDVLWEQAIDCFIKSPVVGTGILTKFRLKTGVWANGAHSQFLDLLAKYGILVFTVYILIPICALYKAAKYDKYDKHFIAIKSIIVFVILFHSIIDNMYFYHFILIMLAVELLNSVLYKKY